MKKLLLSLMLIFSSRILPAQNVENPSFDSAYIGGIDRMHAWITSDAWYSWSIDTVGPMAPNTHFVGVGLQYHELLQTSQLEYSGAYSGPLAIKLVSVPGKVKEDGSPYKGFVTNGNHFYTDNSGYIDYSKGGTPFAYRPGKLRGHFKFDNTSPSLTNFGKIAVLLKKYNTTSQQSDTVGYAVSTTQFFSVPNWTLFELPINYYSNQIPDSVVVVLESSAFGLSSTFWVDSLGFYNTVPAGVTNLAKDIWNNWQYNSVEQMIYLTRISNLKSARLFDVNGRVVSENFVSKAQLSTHDLSEGIYLLELVNTDSQRKTVKIQR